MNKIFKVVWSKTKECYVVVSEVAKNNSGKKKVLASVLAALAVVGAGAGNVGAYSAGGGNDNGNTKSVAIGNASNTNGDSAVAIGDTNQSKKLDTITIGHTNTANTMGGIAIGLNNMADSSIGDPTTANKSNLQLALGRDNRATSLDTIAIGREVNSTKTGAVAMGSRINANGDFAVAIGNSSAGGTVEAGDYAVAVGFKAKATGGRSIAQGGAAEAAARASIAMGLRSKVNAQKATSNYEFSGSNGVPTPAGYDTETITVNSAPAPSSGAVAGNFYDAGSGIAIGEGATVSDESDHAVVVGAGAETKGNAHYSVVLGSGSHADASDGFVAGHGSYVKSRESIAIGSGANVSGNENIRSQAIGYGATVTGTGAYDATAIGATAQVTGVQGGVALGAGSMLDRTTASNENVGWNSKYLDGTVVRNRAYKATVNSLNDQWDAGAQIGAVSVGNDVQKRQIINVAAGNKDTDAVNVAQLKNVGVRVGADTNTATIGGNKAAADFLAYNGQLNIKGDSNRVTTVSENDANGKDANVNVKFDYDGLVKAKAGSSVTVNQKTEGGKTVFEIDAAAANKTVVADGKNTTVTGAGTAASPYKVNVEGALTGISSITNNSGGKIEFATGGTTISGGPVNVSNNKITGVAKGDVNATSTDAVNGSQLYAVKAAERHIKPTTTGHEYTVDSNGNVTMTYLDGNNNAVTGEQAVITGIAKQDLSNITNEGKKEITKLGTIVKAGDNVTVTSTSDATTGRTTYTVNAVTPAVYTKADGTKVVKRPDGTYTTNLDGSAGNDVAANDVIVSFKDAAGNTTGGNSIVNNVGSAIKNQTGATYLDKLDAAAGDTKTQNAAVNVTDLKNTADGLTNKGLKFNANEGGVKTNKLGSTVTVQGSGALAAGKAYADEYNTANIRTKIEQGTDGNTTINVGLAKALKDINSISNGSSSITLNSNPGGTNNTPAVQITGGNLSMGNGTTNHKIVNLAPGTDDTDAVNYGQIKDLRTEVKPGANITVNKTQGADGHDIYTISSTATGGTASSWNIKSSADTTNGGATVTGHDANAVNISDQKTVEMVAGKNLTVKQGATTDGAKVEFALNKDLSNLDKVVVNGKDGQPGKDGVTILGPQGATGATGIPGTNGIDGKVGIAGKDGKDAVSIAGKDGVGTIGLTGPQGPAGADGKGVDITTDHGTKTLVNPEVNNGDKSERIVYVPKDKDGNPLKDANNNPIKREVATMDDGLKFGGDMGAVGAVKLNKQVDVKGGITDANKLATGNNIGVTSVPDTTTGNTALNIQLAKDLTGLNSVQLGGNTIKTDGDHITITSPDTSTGAAPGATTTTKVANLSDEKHIKEGTYAVANDGSVTLNYQDGNKKDLTETAKITGIAKQDLSNITNDGKKEITKLGTIVKAGDNVTVTSASDGTTGRTTYTVNAVTPAIYTDKNGNKVVKRPDGTYTTNLDGSAGNDVAANDVIVSFKDADGNTTGGNSIINNVGSAIKTQNPTMPAGQTATYLDKLKAAADDTKTQNAAVNVSDLHSTANALKDSELHIAPTAGGKDTDKGGVASGNTNPGAAAQAYKYNATTKQVELTFNDGNGKAVTGPKAVIDFSDLNIPAATTSYSFKTNATGNLEDGTTATATEVANGKTVNYDAGKNLTVKQEIGTDGNHTYTYALNKDLTNLDKVVVNGKDGQPGKDGVTILGPQGATGATGIPGTNGIDGKVGIAGKDGKDAVSISGKDGIGHIGLTGPAGKDGKNATADITVKEGKAGVDGKDGVDGITRIVYQDKDGNEHEVATHDDGMKFAGDDGQTDPTKVIKKHLNNVVDIVGGADSTKLTDNNIGVNNDNGKLKVQLAKDINLTDAGSLTVGGTKVNNDGITIKAPTPAAGVTPTTDVKLTNTGLDNGGNKIVNVKAGDVSATSTDAVNGSQLHAVKVAERHIKPDTYAVDGNGKVTMKYVDGDNKDVAGEAVITGIAKQDLSNISDAGKNVITGLGTIVKAGDNVTVSEAADATTGQKTYTVNAVTPAIYTDKNGNKVVKRPDGTYTTNLDGSAGNDVAANDVIVSFKDADGNTTGGNSIINNVGSAIKTQNPTMPAGQTATYLDKLKAAADDTKTQNAAVNVSDLHNTANALRDNELHIAPTAVKTGSTEVTGGVASGNTNPGAAAQAYKYNATTKQVELTFNDGNGKAVADTKAVIDLSELAGSIQNYGFKTNAAGNLENGTTATATAVANGKTVTYASGKNLTVKQEISTDGNQTYTYALNKDLTNLDKVVVNGKDGIDGKDGVSITGPKGESAPGAKDGQDGKVGIAGKDGKDAVSISGKDGVGHIGLTGPAGKDGKNATADITVKEGKAGVDGKDGVDGITRIVYQDKDGNEHEVATHDDGMKFAGDDGQTDPTKVIKKHLNNVVDIVGGADSTKLTDNNIGVNNDNGKLKIQLAKDVNLTDTGSIKFGNTADDNTVINKGGITITKPAAGTDPAKTVSLTGDGLNNGGNTITNVAAGKNDTDAVNVKQLKDKVTTVESSDNTISVTDKNAPTSATYDATKGHQYDIKINNQGVVNNAQLPVVYTKADGTKVYKQPDGSFNTAKDGSGTVVNAGDVIASMNSAGDSTTAPTKLNNVGSSIVDHATPGVTTPTFLDKIDAAAGDNNTKNGAVNVSDLKNTADAIGNKGLNFGAQSGTDIHKNLGEKLEIVGEGTKADDNYSASNIKTMTKDGKVVIGLDKDLNGLNSIGVPGKDGVAGKDGVSISGKDGANGIDGKVGIGKDGKDAVSISGKDGVGHIGLTGPAGKDGKNATADITVKEGKAGVDGKDGITRIVYQDKDGNEHQVATHDDGLKFTGNNESTVNKHPLNSLVKIQGEGVTEAQSTSFQSAAGNINVKANGTDTLEIQLNKDLKGINSIRNSANGPVMNFNAGDIAISGGNLDMGDSKITHLGKGTNDTDAVNLKQLKDSRTIVKSTDGTIGVNESENSDGAKVYDLTTGASPRFDELENEIGRTGAQGAALSALKPIQYDPLEPTQIMAGYGNYRGNSAVALGVAHYKNESTLIHGGISWAGGSSHMMANAGVTWKVGNRDSEAAVADRYRKGPISSAYAMQQEMAAMKAQNAGLKGEVSDLKAENEQMKAQIAAMMAKLGL